MKSPDSIPRGLFNLGNRGVRPDAQNIIVGFILGERNLLGGGDFGRGGGGFGRDSGF